ncbi:uncharacterized protein LOC132633611 [Lycium barbarum]|uniref:uncharacterized protein LOC132633611 n=1 Tax=Lycium barbarum TaxID=112863 RepID=UPI00293F07AF|nr:uncharacterized protein LOC132633611 [Lycium barbarum]
MATSPPPGGDSPPDQCHLMCLDKTLPPQVESLQNSTHSSTNLQNSNAVTVAISQEQLSWAQEIISQANSSLIRVIPSIGSDSNSHDLLPLQVSAQSLLPIERSEQANLARIATESPKNRLNIRPISGQIRPNPSHGGDSSGQGDPPCKNSDHLATEIVGEEVSGGGATAATGILDQGKCQTVKGTQAHLPTAKGPIVTGPIWTNIEFGPVGDLQGQEILGTDQIEELQNSVDQHEIEDNTIFIPNSCITLLSLELILSRRQSW